MRNFEGFSGTDFVNRIFFLFISFRSGCFLRMLSRGGIHVVNSGDTIHLTCDFYMDRFNLFDNPVLWRKIQHQEEMQINMMGNILEPFEATNRFAVTFVPEQSKYVLGLQITSASLEDSGNYTCEVNGPQNVILGFVTNYIFVRAAVLGILIVKEENETSPSSSSPSSTLVFTEGEPNQLRCVAFGGYPPPHITLSLDSTDIAAEFDLTYTAFISGVRGLRVTEYTTDKRSANFRVKADDDGKIIKCVASVSGMSSTSEIARITVQYAPLIVCQSTSSSVGDRNVFLRCHVKAKPEVTSLFWLTDVNGTTVTEGEVINEFWTLSRVHGDGILETSLYLRTVIPTSFREYRLVAENAIAIRTKEAFLHEASTFSTEALQESNSTRRDSRGGGKRAPLDAAALPLGLEFISNVAGTSLMSSVMLRNNQLTVPILMMQAVRYFYVQLRCCYFEIA